MASPISFATSTADTWNIGFDNGGASLKYAFQTFAAPEDMIPSVLTANVSKLTNNTSAYVEIFAVDGSDHATGSALATSDTIAITSATMVSTNFTFTGAPTLTNGTHYSLRFVQATDLTNANDRIVYYTSGSSVYAGGTFWSQSGGGTWDDKFEDLYGQLAYTTGGGVLSWNISIVQ